MNPLLNFALASEMHALTVLSWKGAMFALLVGLTILVLRRRLSSAWRHALWLLVLVRFAVPDLGTSPVSMSGWLAVPRSAELPVSSSLAAPPPGPHVSLPNAAPAEPGEATEAFVAPVPSKKVAAGSSVHLPAPRTAWHWLTLVWLSGAGLVVGVMVVLHVRMAVRVRLDREEPSLEARASLCAAAGLAGVRRVPELIVTDAVRAPALFGLVRPAILLPREMAASCDSASLHLILLHELAHLQRRDLWSQVAASLIVALHWFNPFAWWAVSRLRAEAEMAADAWALRHTDAHEAHRMGELLLRFSHHAAAGWVLWFGAATSLGISENKRNLRRRIEALMDVARGRRPWWVMGLAVFVALAVVGLTNAPAQDAAKTAAKEATPAAAKAGAKENTTTVAGIVVDDAGEPIKGALCSLKIGDRESFEVRKATSDAEGRFRFEGVAVPAKLTLSGYDDGHMNGNPRFINFNSEEPSQERRIILPKAAAWVTGAVTRKADGMPVKDAEVYVGPQFQPQMVLRSASRKATTDEAGRYRIVFGSVETKGVVVLVDAPGMALTVTSLPWKEGELSMDQSLEPDAGISGSVVNAEGKPVAGATVCLSDRMLFLTNGAMHAMIAPDGTDFYSNNLCYWFGKPQTDEKGGFSGRSLDARPPGNQRLIAIHPTEGFQYLLLKDWKKGGTIKLERFNTLHGKLMDTEGNAVKGGEIRLSDSRYERDDKGGFAFSITNMLSATSDNEGRYKIDRILPHAQNNTITVNGEFNTSTKLNLKSGETEEFNLRLRPKEAAVPGERRRTMTGRVVAPAGTPSRNDDYNVVAMISRVGGSVELVYADAKGKFETKPSEPGSYKIQVYVEARDAKKFSSAANAGVSMTFKLEPDAKQQAMDLGDFPLDAAAFVLRPPLPRLPKAEAAGSGRHRSFAPVASMPSSPDRSRSPLGRAARDGEFPRRRR